MGIDGRILCINKELYLFLDRINTIHLEGSIIVIRFVDGYTHKYVAESLQHAEKIMENINKRLYHENNRAED